MGPISVRRRANQAACGPRLLDNILADPKRCNPVRGIDVSDDDGGHAIDIRQDGRHFCRSALARDGLAGKCRIKRERAPTNTRESSTAIAMTLQRQAHRTPSDANHASYPWERARAR